MRILMLLILLFGTFGCDAMSKSPPKLSEKQAFVNFFVTVFSDGKINEEKIINRWSALSSVCVFGDRGAASRKNIDLVWSLLAEFSTIEKNIVNVDLMRECPADTFYYIYISTKKETKKIAEDYMLLMGKLGRKRSIDIPVGPGFSQMIDNENGNEFLWYIHLQDFSHLPRDSDAIMSKDIVQEEIFQAVVSGSDIEIKSDGHPIISEIVEFPTGIADDDTAEWREKYVETNAVNLCKYDLMVLMTIYSGDPSVADSKIGQYLAYIDNNYEMLSDRADSALADPKYADLITKPC